MASFNKVIIAGNLTRDPELRYMPNGKAVVRLGLAVNRTYTTDAGERKEDVTFIDVDAFGRQAEVISQYMRKGRPLLVEGRLKLDQWEDKTTHQKQSKLKVILESFSFIDSNRSEGAGGAGAGAAGAGGAESMPVRPRPAAAQPAAVGDSTEEGPQPEDDVPF